MKFTVEKHWDNRVFKHQHLFLVLLVLFSLGFRYYTAGSFSSPEQLKVNINEASMSQLEKVPYIGRKTATKILNLRKKQGRFKDLKELKKIRYYKKFKYFLKVE